MWGPNPPWYRIVYLDKNWEESWYIVTCHNPNYNVNSTQINQNWSWVLKWLWPPPPTHQVFSTAFWSSFKFVSAQLNIVCSCMVREPQLVRGSSQYTRPLTNWGFKKIHALLFISINIFQPSLKVILNLSRFQPWNILGWFLKVQITRDLFNDLSLGDLIFDLRKVIFHIPTITTKVL